MYTNARLPASGASPNFGPELGEKGPAQAGRMNRGPTLSLLTNCSITRTSEKMTWGREYDSSSRFAQRRLSRPGPRYDHDSTRSNSEGDSSTAQRLDCVRITSKTVEA